MPILGLGSRWQVVRTIPALILVALVALGVAKIYVGMSRNRPVSLLVTLSIITGVIALAFFLARPRATPFGEHVLLQLKLDNAALQTTARSRPQMLTPGDMAYAIGLFGIGSLPVHEFEKRNEWIESFIGKLEPPKFPAGIDQASAERGKAVYAARCAEEAFLFSDAMLQRRGSSLTAGEPTP